MPYTPGEAQKTSIVTVPIRTPMYEADGRFSRVWTLFLQSLATPAPLSNTHAKRVETYTDAASNVVPGAYGAGKYPVGTQFYESDRGVWYVVVDDGTGAHYWKFDRGEMRGDLADIPTDLTADDEGFIYFVTTGTGGTIAYHHRARWTGTAWEATGRWGGYFAYYRRAPVDPGWQATAAGASTKELNITGGAIVETAVTLLAENGLYRKSASSYSGALVTAAIPNITGSTGLDGAHNHTVSTDAGADVTGLPVGATTVQSGTGASVASTSHIHAFDPGSAGGTTSTEPDHNHSAGTLELDSAGDPAHLNLLPYFRR